MGIPSYFSYIVKNHASILHKLSLTHFTVDNFYLDCNSIIYDVVHKIDFSKINEKDTDYIINNICYKIDEYIKIIQPIHNILIAFDGVAPVAKLDQQRQRRYKSMYQNKISKTIYKDSLPDPWNTTAITPGTVFMNKLSTKIHKFFKNPKKFKVNNIIVSTSTIYGEGEHKIFEFIRNYSDQHNNKVTVVYGLDADLIMLCINHLRICNHIYLFRETPEFIKSVNSELEPNCEYLLDIHELAKAIITNMNSELPLQINTNTTINHNIMYDYIFMCFFLGNDFMPHFPSVNIRTGGIDKLINAYKHLFVSGQYLVSFTDKIQINWINVSKLIRFLSDNEENNIKNETKLRDKREKYKISEDTENYKFKQFEYTPMYERKIEKYINPFNINWQKRYYQSLFKFEYNEENIKSVCINFFEGLEWNMKYYTTGCADWRWTYKYEYPPLFCDLLRYIPCDKSILIMDNPPNPVTEIVQLCYVLPKNCLYLLPKRIYNILNKEWYIDDCEFLWAYCKYFWESHALLPNININELECIIQKLNNKTK